jgi:hypothetical protein
MALPLVSALVVLPTASSRSVISRAPCSALENSAMPPALSVMGPNVSIARMNAVVMSMPIVATAVPKMAPTLSPFWLINSACAPSAKLANRAIAMVIAVTAVVSKPTAVPLMMFVAGPVRLASAISRTGRNVPAV